MADDVVSQFIQFEVHNTWGLSPSKTSWYFLAGLLQLCQTVLFSWIVFCFACISITLIISLRFNLVRFLHFLSFFLETVTVVVFP